MCATKPDGVALEWEFNCLHVTSTINGMLRYWTPQLHPRNQTGQSPAGGDDDDERLSFSQTNFSIRPAVG